MQSGLSQDYIDEGYEEYLKIINSVEHRNIKNFHYVEPNITSLIIEPIRINIFYIYPWLGLFLKYAPFCKNIKLLILFKYFELSL